MPHPIPELRQSSLAAYVSAGVLLVAGSATLALVERSALSELMGQHLLVMNVVAPVLGAAMARLPLKLASNPRPLGGAALAQMLLLWGWHAPLVQQAAGGSLGLHLLMLGLLAAAAILFWATTLRAAAEERWSAIAALLITGKLACLLGGLMIFAPRELYGLAGLAFSICTAGPSTLADQQLAGLMMIVACPLSYIVAGLIMTMQMLARLELRSARRTGALAGAIS